jgi:hypothetical protein
MNRDHSLGFFAGLIGGIALGVACASRRQPSFRKLIAQKSRELKDIADSAVSLVEKSKETVMRQHDAVMNAIESGKKSYLKTAG